MFSQEFVLKFADIENSNLFYILKLEWIGQEAKSIKLIGMIFSSIPIERLEISFTHDGLIDGVWFGS